MRISLDNHSTVICNSSLYIQSRDNIILFQSDYVPKDNLFMFEFGDRRNKGLDQENLVLLLAFPTN